MADLTITEANVQHASGASLRQEIAGVAITAGQVVYKDSSDSKVKLADATDANKDEIYGIAANSAPGADQPITIQKQGGINLGATLTVGEIYVLSTGGAIAPEADLASNDYVSVLGVATTASNLKMGIINSGIQVP